MLGDAAGSLTQLTPYLRHLTEVCKSASVASERVAAKGVHCPKNICDSSTRGWIWNISECLWKQNITKLNPKPHFQNHLFVLLIPKRPVCYFQRGEQPFNFP